ncbi:MULTISPECIES: flavodoxin family protein [unclassified Oceanispirochaeta]|uniref:flavodoxin family protein n=1 Tax=unclassified Oceanispirochaeta TaxID=2635722 RepID=UPI000E0910A5|nr:MULTISPECIES: flavodoxin family protein [unclassified Oceanispirochaeta]MBF9017903.1 flavodoxin [Oceanispirochaeta sp. M2]NPD74414.1 flavodoxin [Oceanispirochaeta sp. M1]RDG29715.1 flavodoxin [Oceanispirochaeta sp. M1]
MKIAVRYFSRTGNTEKLARAIGEQLNIDPQSVDIPLEDDVEILFLGSALYALNIDKQMKGFIESLRGSSVKKVFVFSTTALLTSSYPVVSKNLQRSGIKCADEEFHCYGAFGALHKNRPDANDLKAIKKFANKIFKQYKDQ